jgi:DNA-binding transcriptional LysR family regulator
VFVEGPDTTGLSPRPFRRDELVMVLPRKHRLAGRKPLAFADALDEDWISLNTGAAMLQQLQQAALAANRPLRLRMQVRSFDAVCHLVASGLGRRRAAQGGGAADRQGHGTGLAAAGRCVGPAPAAGGRGRGQPG